MGYFWLFENNTRNTIFEATFVFELTNMKIEGQSEKTNEWHVRLKPGEECVKKLILKDPT